MLEGSSLKPLEQSAVKVGHFNLSVRSIHWKRENLSTHKRSLKVRAQNGYFIPWLVALWVLHPLFLLLLCCVLLNYGLWSMSMGMLFVIGMEF